MSQVVPFSPMFEGPVIPAILLIFS